MRNYDDGTIDAAIDRAVLDIMGADTRPGFRRRVLARIEPGWPASSWLRSPLLAVAALLMFAIVATLVYSMRSGDRPSTAQVVAALPPAVPGPSPAVSQAHTVQAPAPPRAVAPKAAPRAVRRSEAVFGPRSGLVGAANVPLGAADRQAAATRVLQDEPPSFTPADELPPIVIAPIEVAPIRIPPARTPIR